MLIACICAVSQSLGAQTAKPGKQTPEPSKPTPQPGKLKEFIAVQRLLPRLYDGEKWTKEDIAATDRHLIQFHEATKSGQLILAGRTD